MSLANSYAKALYEAAQEESPGTGASSEILNEIELQLAEINSTLKASKEVQVALLGLVTTSREKAQIVEEISKKMKSSDLIKRFLVLLARKGRLDLLEEIKGAFNSIRLEISGGISGRLISADSIKESDIETLAKAFSKKLGKKIAFQVSTDPSLLAGIKVIVNGVTYDGTLRSQIQKLRDRFVVGFPGAHA